MIFRRFALFSLLAVFTVTSGARAVDKVKLRKAVSLPVVIILSGYGVNGWRGFEPLMDDQAQPEKIAEIERQLKGDVTDADAYSRLAPLYVRTGQLDKAEQARHNAVRLFRKQVEARPNDNAARLDLAEALEGVKEWKEAETLFRQAVENWPNDWHPWIELGRFLGRKSWRTITGGQSAPGGGPEEMLHWIRDIAPTAERIAESRRQRGEADSCFEKAIALAPRESAVYRQRGAFRFEFNSFDGALRSYLGEKPDPASVLVPPEALSDLRRAVDLASDEYMGIGMVTFAEATAEAYKLAMLNPPAKQPDKLMDLLTDSTRKRVREGMARLEKGTQHPNKLKAAEAAEVLGFLQMMLDQDFASAEKNLRSSIALNPSSNAAWQSLVMVLKAAEKNREAAEACRQRLKHKDCAHNRLFLAKALQDLGQLDKAEAVIREGLHHAPDDFMLRVCLRIDLGRIIRA